MGDEARKSYKYTSNKDGADGTEVIHMPGREPVRKGGVVELTEAEHDLLKARLNLHEVDAPKNDEPKESDEKSDSTK